MNLRVKHIRETLEHSQKEFGDKINLTKSAISLIESGKRNLSERTISDICRVYSISEKWLRDGAGDMFTTYDDVDPLDLLIAKYPKNIRKAIKALDKLSDEDLEVMDKYIDMILNEE